MDGIAVRAADLAAAPGLAESAGVTAAAAVRLPAGMFEWIDTGDPMPAGTDTVVVRERLLPQADGSVLVTAAAAAGSGQRRHAAPQAERAGGGRGLRRRGGPGARGAAAPAR